MRARQIPLLIERFCGSYRVPEGRRIPEGQRQTVIHRAGAAAPRSLAKNREGGGTRMHLPAPERLIYRL